MFAVSNNGLSIRAVAKDYTAQDGEVLFSVMDISDITEEMVSAAFPGYTTAVKQEKLAQLNAAYLAYMDHLSKCYSKATALGYTTVAEDIQTEIVTVKAQYEADLAEINS